MLKAAQNNSNWSNEIKMLKNTTTLRIKSFVSLENINVEKLRFTKINANKFSQVCLA